jgi:nucleoside-diphosphate-sugar epimerase
LITGGAGFIGANIVRKLLEKTYNVNLILKKSTNPWRIRNVLSKLKIYEVDLLDKENLKKTIHKIKPTIIFHLSAFSDYRNQEDFEQMVNVNVIGTMNLLLASKEIDYRIFVNTGSSSEYGLKNIPMNEKDLLEPISFYAATKASTTLMCGVFAREFRKPIITLRPFSVYGPYENQNRFIPTIIKCILEKRPIRLTSGSQRRDFIYIDDVVNAYIKMVKGGKKITGQIFNIGTGIEHTNDEIVSILFKVVEKKVPIKKGGFPLRIWDNPHWVADASKIKKNLDWKPKYTLKQGLKKTYKWFKNA